MTWSRPISGGSTFPSNEALLTRAIPNGKQQRRPAATATSDRVSRLLSGGGAEKGPSKNAAKNNEKHIEGGKRNTTTGKKDGEVARKEASQCGQASEIRICNRNTVYATKSEEIVFTDEEKEAGISTESGSSEQSVDSRDSITDSVSVSTGVSNSTEEKVTIEYGKDLLLFGFSDTMEDTINSFNDSFNGSFRYPFNISYNETFIVLEGMYPSGYTLLHIIIASIFATLLMIVIVVGNMLVIIAIATEKALKNIQNWFIASLAVADFFLGLVIMPFSLANEIMGYWIFGYWWCDIHSAMDVLLCTASIMNLCLISLDRFWSITQAVDYLKKRTPARAALMIALVWLLSALVCIPPLLGWKRPTPAEEYPKCKVSYNVMKLKNCFFLITH